MDELFATFYVDSSRPYAGVLQAVAKVLDGEVARWTVETEFLEVDVRSNDDYRSPQRASSPDNFLYFPYTLDVEAVGGNVGLDPFLAAVSKLMIGLAGLGMRVVVACDWEEQLPGRGRLGFS
jgi:hypothetical protein